MRCDLQVELRPISSIRPYPKNPRINDQAVSAVADSIKEFGFRQPIVVDESGEIIIGHTRYLAALRLGLEQVPVHVACGLSPPQIKALRIADNQTNRLSDWHQDRLIAELKDLEKVDFDLLLTGFTPGDLESLLAQPNLFGQTDPDAVPEPPDEPVTRRGDLWVLGSHRLLCGDSACSEEVDRLLAGAPIHLVNVDPPYNTRCEPRSNNAIAAGMSSFDVKHHQRFDLERHPEKSQPTAKKLRPRDRQLINDFVSTEEFDRLLRAWFGNISRVLLPGHSCYAWGGYKNCADYPPVLKRVGL